MLNISGWPWRAKASSRASRQKIPSKVHQTQKFYGFIPKFFPVKEWLKNLIYLRLVTKKPGLEHV
ncbi:MAG: hypothetical protein COA81_07725 [Alphaproteobacteria bacterium]|nr:MAG: hypothetical protein COA81_07725 [Alphaproteobacteria bacterium]